MKEEVVLVKEKQICEIILNNLFSEDTNRFFENCEFSSYRTVFMDSKKFFSFSNLKKFLSSFDLKKFFGCGNAEAIFISKF